MLLCVKKYRYTREQFVTKREFKAVLFDLFKYLGYEAPYTWGQFCIRFPRELFLLMKKVDSHSDIVVQLRRWYWGFF